MQYVEESKKVKEQNTEARMKGVLTWEKYSTHWKDTKKRNP